MFNKLLINKNFFRYLFAIIVFIIFSDLISNTLLGSYNFLDLFSTIGEKNIPTLFSTLQLMLSSHLLYLIYKNIPSSIKKKHTHNVIESLGQNVGLNFQMTTDGSSGDDVPNNSSDLMTWIIARWSQLSCSGGSITSSIDFSQPVQSLFQSGPGQALET